METPAAHLQGRAAARLRTRHLQAGHPHPAALHRPAAHHLQAARHRHHRAVVRRQVVALAFRTSMIVTVVTRIVTVVGFQTIRPVTLEMRSGEALIHIPGNRLLAILPLPPTPGQECPTMPD